MDNNYTSNYEVILNRLASQGKVRYFSDEENLKIVQGLNYGLEDFLLQQKKRDVESALELRTIYIKN